MFGINIDDNNINVERKGLESLLTDKPEAAKRLREVIRKLLWEARNEVSSDIRGKFGGDREPWRAVRNIVYEKLLGGNINIQNMKRGTAGWKVIQKVRKGTSDPLGRGGNRRHRSLSTAQREGYEGKARGFILRFQNQGTKDRSIRFISNPRRHVDKWNANPNTGNRGSLGGSHFFESSANKALNAMAQKLGPLIDDELSKMYEEQTKS
jgi:hypothetical protein